MELIIGVACSLSCLVGFFLGCRVEQKFSRLLLHDVEHDRDRLVRENSELSRKLRIALGGEE